MLSITYVAPCIASNNAYLDNMIRQAIEKKSYHNKAWLSLLHYHEKGHLGDYYSEADHPSFFFSSKGPFNPQIELIATMEAMFRPESPNSEHPQCSFPARFAWLKKELDIDLSKIPNPDCKCLHDWMKELDVKKVTIVFPAAYLNNPSSMFGHLFMRFEPTERGEGALLMADTINFAADTSAQEGVTDYIYRGIFGGFPSTNSIQPFYKKFKRYSDIESRDIWEYRLNLSKEEMDRLMLHVWELKNGLFDYYFFNENCAYRLLTLLEVARPDLGLSEDFKAYTIPSNVIRGLNRKGVVESIAYRPSAMKTFYHHAKYLDESEARLLFDIVQQQLPFEGSRIQALSPKRRALVLALAAEYLALLINKDMIDRDKSTSLTQEIFSERTELGLPVEFDAFPTPKDSPDKGHKTRRIRFSGGYNNHKDFLSLAYRGAYHSLLDPLPGFEKGAQVELLNIELRDYEYDGVRLEHLKLMNITSLSPINMFFKPASWRFSLGAEKRSIDSEEALVEYAQGDIGVTFNVKDWMAAGMAHLELDCGRNLDQGYGVGSGLFFNLAYQTDILCLNLGLLSMKYLVGEDDLITMLWGKASIPIRKNNALFTEMEYDPKDESHRYEIGFGISHYF